MSNKWMGWLVGMLLALVVVFAFLPPWWVAAILGFSFTWVGMMIGKMADEK